MKNDPDSIKLREQHAKAIQKSGIMHDMLDEMETMALVHPNLFMRVLLWAARKMVRVHDKATDVARIEARKTYEDHQE